MRVKLVECASIKLLADAFKQLPVSSLGLSLRVSNVLRLAGVNTIGQLLNTTEDQLKHFRHCGSKSIREIREKFMQLGIEY